MNIAILQTADEPTQIRLLADRNKIKADGQDLSYVTVEPIDDKGIRNPKPENLLTFELDGEGKIEGVRNANPISTESYIGTERKTQQRRCKAVIKSENIQ